ncbi:MAG: PAS domain S-box protein [Desulfuromonas sp.]|nr:PAS domain S-box protein [Desulfuromonas sp.]
MSMTTGSRQRSPYAVLGGTFTLFLLPVAMIGMFPAQFDTVIDKETYVTFHNAAEFFSIVVSLSVFSVGWFTFEQSRDRHGLLLGTVFLAVGLLDFMHAMSNAAMPAFISPNSTNKSTQFWLAARLFGASTLLASAFVYPESQFRWLSKKVLMTSALLVTAVTFTAIVFFPAYVPATAIQGAGLTPLKRVLEFLVIILLLFAAVAYWKRMTVTGNRLLVYYLAAFIISIFSEVFFASYTTGFDTYNVLGHIYKVIAFCLIYKAVFISSVNSPYLKLADAMEGLRMESVSRSDLEREVEERKRAEESLKLTQASVDGAAELVAWFTSDGKVYYVNETTCRTLGYSREELLKMTALDFSPGFTWEQYEEHWQEVRKRKSFVLETVHRRKDGTEYPTEVLVNYVVYGGQEFIFAYGRDITERKQTEEALARAHEQTEVERRRLEAILETSPVGIVLVEAAPGRLSLVNRRAAEIYGIDYGGFDLETHVASVKVLLPDGSPFPIQELPVNRAFKGEEVHDVEMTIERSNGERVPLSAYAAPLLDTEGNVTTAVILFDDITARKQAEDTIKASLQEKEILLKEVHHRVKNNLQVISSLVDMQADGSKDETVREGLRDVTYRIRSMALVHEKLYHSASLSRVDFGEYAQSLLTYLWRAHGGAAEPIRLTLDLDPVELAVDTAVPCGLILNELAGNALKHAFRGRSDGKVTVSLRRTADGQVSLSVYDNGVGMPAEFDWRKAHSLGLRLVQMLAGQLRGSVEVARGEGTKFTLAFRPKDAVETHANETHAMRLSHVDVARGTYP